LRSFTDEVACAGESTEVQKGASTMTLREKYNHAIQTAKGFRMDGSAEERDGKLHFKGTVQTQDEANKIWDAIKTVPTWSQEIVADIRAAAPAPSTQSPQGSRTYTVKKGDTLSRIAKEFLGDANAYMDIFNANRDQLTDPDEIKPGQVLKIPQPAHK
jgi:nucleoid-associated protein YgaU